MEKRSRAGRHRNNLTALVIAAGGADPVRHVRGRALRAGAQLWQGKHAVVRAAHALTTSRRFAFGDTHRSSVLNELNELNALNQLNRAAAVLQNPKASVCSVRPRQTIQAPPGRHYHFVSPFPQRIPAARGMPAHTADAAETRAEYLPAHRASSPRSHLRRALAPPPPRGEGRSP